MKYTLATNEHFVIQSGETNLNADEILSAVSEIQSPPQSDWEQDDTTASDYIKNKPTIPTTLPASDVYDWAKASSKPSYTASEVGLGNVGNFKAVSTVASQGLSSTEQSNARANIGLGSLATKSSLEASDIPSITKSKISDFPSSMPASDVYTWAKASSKPSYSYSEISNTPSSLPASDVSSWAKSPSKPSYSFSEITGTVGSSQLPSYVDDVLEYDAKSGFPATGEGGKIYVNKANNTTWRWSGTAYVQIKGDIVIGTTSGTAYDGASGAALKSKLDGIESGAQAHKAPTTAEVKSALGTGSGTSKYLREDGTWQTPPNDNTTTSINGKTGAITAADMAAVLTAAGYKLTDTDTNTWRTVQCNSTSIGDNTLNLVAGTNVTLTRDGGKVTISSTDTNTWPSKVSQLTNDTGYITGITSAMVTNALGYTPPTTNSTYNFYGTNFYSGGASYEAHDCNSATGNGHYYYSSNGPSTSIGASTADGALFTQSYSSSWVAQIAQDYRNGRLFVRGKKDGTWQSWVRVANYNEIPSSLPASDVYSWAKASTKPSYSYSEISGTPSSLPANGGNADTVDNYHIAVVSSMPSSPNSNTIYIVK